MRGKAVQRHPTTATLGRSRGPAPGKRRSPELTGFDDLTTSMHGGPLLTTTRSLTRVAGLVAAAAVVFAACSSSTGSSAPSAAASGGASAGGPSQELIAAAKAEGGLTTIALPHTWCNYGEMLDGFTAKYGIPINELLPDGGSAERDRRHQGQQGQPGTAGAGRRGRRPLVRPAGRRRRRLPAVQGLDLGHDPGLRPRTRTATGMATTTASCRSRPTPQREERPEGLVRPAQARVQGPGRPVRRPDRVQPGHLGRLGRSPRQRRRRSTTSSRVSTSSSSSTTRATSSRSSPSAPTVASGETPIRITLDLQRPRRQGHARRQPADRGRRSRRPVASAACTSRRSASTRPHPNAAKLWMEYLYSDEGQIIWLKGYCNPIRYEDMVARSVDPGRSGGEAAGHQGRRPADARPDHGRHRRPSPRAGRRRSA